MSGTFKALVANKTDAGYSSEIRDITLDELRRELGEAGVTVAISTLHRFFVRHGITRKKRPGTRLSRTAPTS